MQRFISQIAESVDQQLQDIDLSRKDILEQAGKAKKVLECAFCKLKKFIIDYQFKDEAEEISFFKEIKPRLYSKFLLPQGSQSRYALSGRRQRSQEEVLAR